MGDIADACFDRAMDELLDGYDFDFYDSGRRPARIRCQHCGVGATWTHTGVRWALLDNTGRLHNCRTGPASTDEFEDCRTPEDFA